MPLYHFNPHGKGKSYLLVRNSKKEALDRLMVKLLDKSRKSPSKEEREFYRIELERWKNTNVDKFDTFPKPYTLDEHETDTLLEF